MEGSIIEDIKKILAGSAPEKDLIKTSDVDWLEKSLKCYRDKRPFEFLDDAEIGIDKEDLLSAVTLIRQTRRKLGTTRRAIGQILTGLGMSTAGIWLIMIAVVDPDPTSKLGILLAGGVILITTGGLSILWAFGQKWKVSGKAGKAIITVEPR